MAKVFDTPPAVAVRAAAVAVETVPTAAVKLADVAPAATVTDAGTVIELVLLERETASPPAGAAAVSVTVHASVPEAE